MSIPRGFQRSQADAQPRPHLATLVSPETGLQLSSNPRWAVVLDGGRLRLAALARPCRFDSEALP